VEEFFRTHPYQP